MYSITHLSKYYGKVKAVDDVSFDVQQGEVFGLLGRNGAGKTTTLRTLATLLAPTSGTAAYQGMDLVKDADKLRGYTGLLFGGDTGLYERLTARENIVYLACLNGVLEKEADRRAVELAGMFHFTEFLDIRAAKLSKGTRQKAAFARAIVHDPTLMLFDEPTVGLDVTARRDAEEFILQCKANGKHIILSDHVLSVVERLCDRVGIMEQGKLLDVGTIPQLLEKYQSDSLEAVFFKLAGDNRGESA